MYLFEDFVDVDGVGLATLLLLLLLNAAGNSLLGNALLGYGYGFSFGRHLGVEGYDLLLERVGTGVLVKVIKDCSKAYNLCK